MTRSFEIWAWSGAAAAIAAVTTLWMPTRLLRLAELPKPSLAWKLGFIVSIGMGCIIADVVVRPSMPIAAMGISLLIAASVATAWYDASYFLIPDLLPLAIVIAALMLAYTGVITLSYWGALLCAGLLAALAWVWRRTHSEEALGFGDVKLAAALGLMLGVERSAWMLATAASSGALWAITVARIRSTREAPLIPFGLFLAICGASLILSSLR
jgi:prepilin signal peptidase PulO-like enzyme (type II secretory pathway)